MEDYSKLEGKEVKLINNNGYYPNLLLIGCDKDVGLTLVDATDHTDNIICLNGRLSPVCSWGGWPNGRGEKVYNALFNVTVEMIKTGILDMRKFSSVKAKVGKLGEGCSGSVKCAFSQ